MAAHSRFSEIFTNFCAELFCDDYSMHLHICLLFRTPAPLIHVGRTSSAFSPCPRLALRKASLTPSLSSTFAALFTFLCQYFLSELLTGFEILKGWAYVSFIFVSSVTTCGRNSVEDLLNKLMKLHKIETMSDNLACGGICNRWERCWKKYHFCTHQF